MTDNASVPTPEVEAGARAYLNYFRTHLDNYGPDVWIENIDPATGKPLMNYLHTEYNFFGIWAIIAGVILPFRFIYQVWSDYIKKPKR